MNKLRAREEEIRISEAMHSETPAEAKARMEEDAAEQQMRDNYAKSQEQLNETLSHNADVSPKDVEDLAKAIQVGDLPADIGRTMSDNLAAANRSENEEQKLWAPHSPDAFDNLGDPLAPPPQILPPPEGKPNFFPPGPFDSFQGFPSIQPSGSVGPATFGGNIQPPQVEPFTGTSTSNPTNSPGYVFSPVNLPTETLPSNPARDGVSSIPTPYGTAFQSPTREAADLRDNVGNGQTIYRAGGFPKLAGAEGQFWSPKSPLTPGYANSVGAANLGADTPDFVLGGTVNPNSNFITRPAPAYGGNTGGALEVVTDPNSVQTDFFHMPSQENQ